MMAVNVARSGSSGTCAFGRSSTPCASAQGHGSKSWRKPPWASTVIALLALGAGQLIAADYRLMVAAPKADRRAQLVSFAVPSDAPKPPFLRDESGASLAVQPDAGGATARFVIPFQAAGKPALFALTEGPTTQDTIIISRARGDLGIDEHGRRTIVYQTDADPLPRADIDPKFKRTAYLHPLVSPAGVVVTGDYPANHPHHHGIWTSWSKVQFQGRSTNFWEMAEQKGTTEFTGLDYTWNGSVHGGFRARQQLIDFTGPRPVVALNETWGLTAFDVWDPRYPIRAFDLDITQSCATKDAVLLSKHLYGFLGIRGRDEWNGKDAMIVLTSEGATTREAANTSRVRWCYIGGAVENGAIAGLVILSHPQNPRAPEHIRVHPDMPFLSFAPVQSGDLTISPGQPFAARYRVIVFDGPPDRARLEAYWQGFATQAEVTVAAK